MSKKLQPWELVYLLLVVAIVLIGVLHFVLLILKVERELNVSFMVIASPALIAYGIGAILFAQLSRYWWAYRSSLKLGIGFGALFIFAVGSFLTQLMLSLKFDLIKKYTLAQSMAPLLIGLGISSVLISVSVYVGAKKLRAFKLFYLAATIFILIAGTLHFLLMILKAEGGLDTSFLVVTLPALIAYGLGIALFSQFSLYWWIVRSNFKVSMGISLLLILNTGSLITQLMLALRFDTVKNNTFTQSLLPVVIAFVISSILFIINLYVGAKLAFPFLTRRNAN